jgi:hypothetical protein
MIQEWLQGQTQVIQEGLHGQTQALTVIQEQTRPRHTTKELDASKISITDAKKYFHCGQLPFHCVRDLLPPPKEKISKLVRDYADLMRRQHAAGNIAEVAYVQSYVRSTLLPGLIKCLRNRKFVEAEHERGFTVRLESPDMSSVIVDGITDHTIKFREGDGRFLTIEDKAICLKLSESDIAQARAEMMTELEEMFNSFDYIPHEFYGLLQNGSDWIFIKCTSKDGRQCWSHVKAPPIFTPSKVNPKGCLAVSRFLTEVLSVCDKIVDEMRHPIKLVTEMKLLSVQEENDQDDPDDKEDESDDPEPEGKEDPEPKKKEDPNQIPSSRDKHAGQEGAKKSFEHSHSNKENIILPLTKQNVQKLPTSCRLRLR